MAIATTPNDNALVEDKKDVSVDDILKAQKEKAEACAPAFPVSDLQITQAIRSPA